MSYFSQCWLRYDHCLEEVKSANEDTVTKNIPNQLKKLTHGKSQTGASFDSLDISFEAFQPAGGGFYCLYRRSLYNLFVIFFPQRQEHDAVEYKCKKFSRGHCFSRKFITGKIVFVAKHSIPFIVLFSYQCRVYFGESWTEQKWSRYRQPPRHFLTRDAALWFVSTSSPATVTEGLNLIRVRGELVCGESNGADWLYVVPLDWQRSSNFL